MTICTMQYSAGKTIHYRICVDTNHHKLYAQTDQAHSLIALMYPRMPLIGILFLKHYHPVVPWKPDYLFKKWFKNTQDELNNVAREMDMRASLFRFYRNDAFFTVFCWFYFSFTFNIQHVYCVAILCFLNGELRELR